MNNIIKTNTTMDISKEVYDLVKNGGKYGCMAFAIYVLYDLCVKAMGQQYAFNVSLEQEGKVSFKFSPPVTVVES